jgi:uncharacterized protein involved in exopolysaccharide biosynthesis
MDEDTGPLLTEFLAHCWVHRSGAARIAGGFLAFCLLLAALLPPVWRATAVLVVLPAPEYTVRQDAGSHAVSTSSLALDQIMKAETGILESDALHEETLAALGVGRVYPELAPGAKRGPVGAVLHAVASVILAPWRVTPANPVLEKADRAVRRFGDALTVTPAKDSNVIEVLFRHDNPVVAADAVNAMLARYAARRTRLYDDPQLNVVRQQTDALARAVREADEALTGFKATHAIANYAAEQELLLKRRDDAGAQAAMAAAQAAEQKARVAALDRQIAGLPAAVEVYHEDNADTRVESADDSLVDLRGRLALARVHYLETSHVVTGLLAQIRQQEEARRRMAADRSAASVRAGRSPALDPLLVDRAQAAGDAAAAEARARAMSAEAERLAASLAQLGGEEPALTDLVRRKQVADEAFASASRVMTEQRLTEAEDALRLAKVRVIQPARVPQHPFPVPLLLGIAGAVFGPFFAFLALFLGFALRPRVMTPEGLAHVTGLPVLAVFGAEG